MKRKAEQHTYEPVPKEAKEDDDEVQETHSDSEEDDIKRMADQQKVYIFAIKKNKDPSVHSIT